MPLSPGATPSTGRAQLVLVLARGLGLGLGLSGSLALLEGSLEFSLLAEGKVRMKHAHISKVFVRSESLRSLDEDAANLVDTNNSRDTRSCCRSSPESTLGAVLLKRLGPNGL